MKVKASQTSSVIVFDEPELEFRYGQRLKDPHDGLALFGPCDADSGSQPGSLTYLVIGTAGGIAKFGLWANAMNQPAVDAPRDNLRLWPPFPGFEAVFCSPLPVQPVWSHCLEEDNLIEAARQRDQYGRVYQVVDYYLEALRKASKLDERIGVAICVIPDEIWLNCRSESRVVDPVGQSVSGQEMRLRKAGQLNMFEKYNPEQYKLSPDFRRQLKARSMRYGIPLQIIRESTLRLTTDNPRKERGLTPLSDRMWNIATALYYKSGGKPWRLVTAREGVCYIGIAFRRAEESGTEKTACCAAQMFLNTGDGIVFLGEYGPWYSPEKRQFHLSQSAAAHLLKGVLETYADLGGKALTEIFLHSRSRIDDEEFAGYRAACPESVKLVGARVRLEKNGPRLFRTGSRPVLRGTLWKLNKRSGLLWANGFKPRIATYNGWETPVPLRIDVQYGDTPIERVAQDIFGLTKLNYNACRLGESEPVTVGFSDAVGEILVSNPTVSERKPNFKYYI